MTENQEKNEVLIHEEWIEKEHPIYVLTTPYLLIRVIFLSQAPLFRS